MQVQTAFRPTLVSKPTPLFLVSLEQPCLFFLGGMAFAATTTTESTNPGQKLETDLVRFLLNKIMPIDAIGTVASRPVLALSHALLQFVLFAGLQKDAPVVVDVILSAGHGCK